LSSFERSEFFNIEEWWSELRIETLIRGEFIEAVKRGSREGVKIDFTASLLHNFTAKREGL